jgi:preprotein translocase subunit YajC
MIDNLRKGDSVIVGGLIGKISKVISEDEIEIEISDNVKVKVIRSMVSDLKK